MIAQILFTCKVYGSIVINLYQYPKRYGKTSRCGPFEAEHPKRYQNCFFNP